MWDNVIESMQQFKEDDTSATRGCILAHCMGLGKTLSVCAAHRLLQPANDVIYCHVMGLSDDSCLRL